MTEDYCKKKTATESDFTEDPECFKIINAVLSDTNKGFDPASSEHFSINWQKLKFDEAAVVTMD